MTSPPKPIPSNPAIQPQWSPEARTWVSLLLFIHLFAVFVAVASYTGPAVSSGSCTALFDPYLNNLHLTPTHPSYPFARYHLTHAAQNDVDFSCEVDVEEPDGQRLVIPDPGLWPNVRYRRYQALANAAGFLSQPEGDENLAGILPKSIAAGLLKQHGQTQGLVRVRAHFLAPIDAPGRTDRGPLDDAIRSRDFLAGGQFDLLKTVAEARGRATRARGKGSARSQRTGRAQGVIRMKHVSGYFSQLTAGFGAGWTRFWFTPSDPATCR